MIDNHDTHLEATMSQFEKVLRELRVIYLAETRKRAAAMSNLVTMLERDPAAEEPLSSLTLHFHSLAGTGTSYGFGELSRLGRLGEDAAENRRRLKGACSSLELGAFKSLVARIESTATPKA